MEESCDFCGRNQNVPEGATRFEFAAVDESSNGGWRDPEEDGDAAHFVGYLPWRQAMGIDLH